MPANIVIRYTMIFHLLYGELVYVYVRKLAEYTERAKYGKIDGIRVDQPARGTVLKRRAIPNYRLSVFKYRIVYFRMAERREQSRTYIRIREIENGARSDDIYDRVCT